MDSPESKHDDTEGLDDQPWQLWAIPDRGGGWFKVGDPYPNREEAEAAKHARDAVQTESTHRILPVGQKPYEDVPFGDLDM